MRSSRARRVASVGVLLLATALATTRACAQSDVARPPVPLPPVEAIAQLPPDGGSEFNRLVHESSPYLRQHARNPVDWYPWGPEAFTKAEREGKLVFLSVGYATCHWCHVMERESFENPDVAAILNDRFVAIKVDREERPDVDAVYMAAIHAMGVRGGWPMSVFLTPDRKPVWGGTYFPPEDHANRAGFKSILRRIDQAWVDRREDVLKNANALVDRIQEPTRGAARELGTDTLVRGAERWVDRYDAKHGGFGRSPKFPMTHGLSFLLREHVRTGDVRVLPMVERTLDAMARGGIYDHLGGGFHRYSTDPVWLVPHFEKMLYDQALAVRAYVEAYQVTGNARYADVARDVMAYVLRDLTDERGAFHSAEDADSEGVEGRFYVWTRAEIDRVLTDDGAVFAQVYGVAAGGNHSDEATGEAAGANILYVPTPIAEQARALAMEPKELERRLGAMRTKLLEVRARRVRPLKDDKILADWNGLMIGSLAYAGRVLGDAHYIDAARRAAVFIVETMWRDGRLLHTHRGGRSSVKAYLEDYAFLILGLTDLYEGTFEVRWLAFAKRLAHEMVRLFWDAKAHGFTIGGADAEQLIVRTKAVYDGAIPSGNSAATLALLRIGRLVMDSDLESRARENLAFFAEEVDGQPDAHPTMTMALALAMGSGQEVVLAGDVDAPGFADLRRVVDRRFLPHLVLAHHPTGAGAAEVEALVPFLKDQVAIDGRGTAYLCEGYACQRPTTDAAELERLIQARR